MIKLLASLILLGSGLISGSSLVPQDPASKPGVHVVARRLPDNPIISPATDPSIGTNINGPTLVKVPLWAKDPLGKYYLYFADHNGKYIRLAYSDKVEGPYKVYAPGVLPLASSYFTDHIASPEVVINEPSHQFRLYYHGLTPEERSQHTRVALSTNGRDFAAIKEPVGKGSAYWRLIKRDDWWVALAMPGKLLRSKDGITPFEIGPQLFPTSPTQVHNALLVRGNVLHVFYTRAGDKPEHILHSQVALNGDWTRWKPTDGEDVLLPETPWEGADLPLTAGIIGAVNNRIRALRDPAIFQDGGKTYLLYAIAGESGIGIAELTFD